MSNHVTQQADDVENNINQLEDTMHEAQQFHTLEEQVEDMKRRGKTKKIIGVAIQKAKSNRSKWMMVKSPPRHLLYKVVQCVNTDKTVAILTKTLNADIKGFLLGD